MIIWLIQTHSTFIYQHYWAAVTWNVELNFSSFIIVVVFVGGVATDNHTSLSLIQNKTKITINFYERLYERFACNSDIHLGWLIWTLKWHLLRFSQPNDLIFPLLFSLKLSIVQLFLLCLVLYSMIRRRVLYVLCVMYMFWHDTNINIFIVFTESLLLFLPPHIAPTVLHSLRHVYFEFHKIFNFFVCLRFSIFSLSLY